MIQNLARQSVAKLATFLEDSIILTRSLPSFQGLLSGQGLLLCLMGSITLL